MSKALKLLCTAKLPGNLLERYLEPLVRLDEIEEVVVVRHQPLADRLPKIRNVTFGDHGTARNAASMLFYANRVLGNEHIDWVHGFNPVPWGSIGTAAAARRRVPASLSFIGLDFKQIMSPLALPLWLALKYCRVLTVTGERMRRGLVERGIPESKIRVLPHAIDTERFKPRDQEPDLDVLSVGQLIPRKRMDVLIDAVAELKSRGLSIRAGILGEGPLKAELEAQIERQGVKDNVSLLGFRTDVENVLPRARLFALVSNWEGVPFAMIEALCAGLVPIVTDVGTIADWIEHGKNGHIVPVGDARALADSIQRLLEDRDHYAELRSRAIGARETLSMEAGVRFWRDLLQSVGGES